MSFLYAFAKKSSKLRYNEKMKWVQGYIHGMYAKIRNFHHYEPRFLEKF